MRWIEVRKSRGLKGKIKVPGSKNSSLALLAASCLSEDIVELENIPNISDVGVVISICKDIGVNILKQEGKLIIDSRSLSNSTIDSSKSSKIRTAYYFVGALLAKFKKVLVGYPGGDKIGKRPIDQHIKGLEALGAQVKFFNDHYEVQAESLKGTDIYFDVITCGATINIMMVAVLAEGRTTLHNAARDPEVVDTAVLLNKMGAKIYGAGTDVIRIEGVNRLKGANHRVIPDRLLVGTFMIAAGITEGDITIENVEPQHLRACIDKLREIGVDICIGENSIRAKGNGKLKAVRIITGMYPQFPTDLQQLITVLLLKASGTSVIVDKVYPNRFAHCIELNKMKANIKVGAGNSKISYREKLYGTWVEASDIRAGIGLILAGIIAERTTYVTGVHHLERGVEDIIGVFKSIGGDIKLVENHDEIAVEI